MSTTSRDLPRLQHVLNYVSTMAVWSVRSTTPGTQPHWSALVWLADVQDAIGEIAAPALQDSWRRAARNTRKRAAAEEQTLAAPPWQVAS